MKRFIFGGLGWVLCEVAFKVDCWGPGYWLYRAGCWAYDIGDGL